MGKPSSHLIALKRDAGQGRATGSWASSTASASLRVGVGGGVKDSSEGSKKEMLQRLTMKLRAIIHPGPTKGPALGFVTYS